MARHPMESERVTQESAGDDIAAADQPESAPNPAGGWMLPSSFVWTIWAVMTVAALLYVARYGSNVPSWDEWDMVPTLTGRQPVTWEWLWSQHNEHRVPVPRLILLALGSIFGIDFRTGMYFNVLIASSLSAAALAVIRRIRGCWQWTGAAIPLLLLNLGQGLNFIWGWQVEFFTSTALAGGALLLIVLCGTRPTAGFAMLMGGLLALLVGTGAHGVALVPAISCWMALAGLLRWREGGRRSGWATTALLGAAVMGFVLTAAYFMGYERVPYHPASSGKRASIITTIQFLTMSFGPTVRHVWPTSGLCTLALLGSAGVVALLAAWRNERERSRALGVACFIGAVGCLAIGLGLGRDGFEPRYITLSVPVLLAAYFAIVLYAPPVLGCALRWGMLIAAVLVLWPNTHFGIRYARELRGNLAAFERDVAAGLPPHRLIHDHGRWLHPHPDVVGDYLPMLRDAGVAPYYLLADDPQFHEVPVLLKPTDMNDLEWDAATATVHASGSYPYLIFDLGEPRRVVGIRLRYTHQKSSGGAPYVSLYWKHGEQEFEANGFSKYSPTGDRSNWERGTYLRIADQEAMMTVWVLDSVDAIRLHPDFEPCTFTIHELVLLLDSEE